MKKLRPLVPTPWYAYTPEGILHEGVTMPGEETVTGDGNEFEYGDGIEEKVAKHKEKLKEATDKHPAAPGLYKKDEKVVKLEDKDCEGKKNAKEAAEAMEA